MSITCPIYLSVIKWGLMTKQEQLLRYAGVFKTLLLEKKNYSYLAAEVNESDPWAAFLVPSVPNRPLIEFGLSLLACKEFVGPKSFLHFATQFYATSSNPTTKSELINWTSVLKKDLPLCSA